MNKTQTRKLRRALANQGQPDSKLAIYKTNGLWWVGREDWGMYQTAYPNRYHLTADEAIEAALNGERPERIERWLPNMK